MRIIIYMLYSYISINILYILYIYYILYYVLFIIYIILFYSILFIIYPAAGSRHGLLHYLTFRSIQAEQIITGIRARSDVYNSSFMHKIFIKYTYSHRKQQNNVIVLGIPDNIRFNYEQKKTFFHSCDGSGKSTLWGHRSGGWCVGLPPKICEKNKGVLKNTMAK